MDGRLISEAERKEQNKSRSGAGSSRKRKSKGEVGGQIPLGRVLIPKYVKEAGTNLSLSHTKILKVMSSLLNKKCTKREAEILGVEENTIAWRAGANLCCDRGSVPQLPAACIKFLQFEWRYFDASRGAILLRTVCHFHSIVLVLVCMSCPCHITQN
jgi:hypothetical protein